MLCLLLLNLTSRRVLAAFRLVAASQRSIPARFARIRLVMGRSGSEGAARHPEQIKMPRKGQQGVSQRFSTHTLNRSVANPRATLAARLQALLRPQLGANGGSKAGLSTRPTIWVEQPRTLSPQHRCGERLLQSSFAWSLLSTLNKLGLPTLQLVLQVRDCHSHYFFSGRFYFRLRHMVEDCKHVCCNLWCYINK